MDVKGSGIALLEVLPPQMCSMDEENHEEL